MMTFRVLRLDPEHARRFREAAPVASTHALKLGRYLESGTVEADSPYEAWKLLRSSEDGDLAVGDVLQAGEEPPLLCTYWGFEPAVWDTPSGASSEISKESESPKGVYASSM